MRRIERGARKATPEQIAKLATALGKPAKVLFPHEAAPAPKAGASIDQGVLLPESE